ncbi:MAG: TraE/TraK family type IV conjugative transfer system protein [Nitrososphaeria archaeon]
MNKERYLDERANFARQVRILRFIVFLLAVAVVVNGFFVYTSGINQRTVLVPVVAEGEVYVAGNDASDSYIKAMIDLALFYRMNYSPANVKVQFNSFLKLLSPSFFGEAQTELNGIVGEILENKISSAFYTEEIRIDREKRIVSIKGRLKQWSEDRLYVNEERQVVVKYAIGHGKFMIENLKTCRANEECKL